MNENFIKVTWQTGTGGNTQSGFAVMAKGNTRESMVAAAVVARSVVSVMEKHTGRERAKEDMLNLIREILEQDDEEVQSVGVTITLPENRKG